MKMQIDAFEDWYYQVADERDKPFHELNDEEKDELLELFYEDQDND